jgi:tripartite-type tricarboxylate transporter receptor subunit TctC
MKNMLGVPVVVENVAGSNGVVGTLQVYNSAPDGLTIAMA